MTTTPDELKPVEQRAAPAVSPTTAKKRVRAARWLRGDGIEIGALHNPLPVAAGVNVRYVDRMSVDELRKSYPELAEFALVPVDVIGDAQNLSAFDDSTLDFVIACHLIEHLEDPIRGLAEMMRALKPGGVLLLAVPDPRNTFDRARELTAVEHLIEEYRQGTSQTRRAHYLDWVEHVENTDDAEGRNASSGRDKRVQELMNLDYSIHFHVWRPDTFIDVLTATKRETGVEFELAEFLSCDREDDNEFIFLVLKGQAPTPPAVPAQPEALDVTRLEHEVARIEQEMQRLRDVERQLREAEQQLQAVYGSRSMRFTEPIRKLARRLRARA